MPERLIAQCDKCNHEWVAKIGNVIYPYSAYSECPKCGDGRTRDWLDDETSKLLLQKKFGLLKDNDKDANLLEQRIKTVEANREADRTEIAFLKQRIEILENQKIQDIRNSLSDRITEIEGLTEQVRDIKDKIKFQEENK